MIRRLLLSVVIWVTCFGSFASAAAEDKPQLALAKEYIRELAELEELRQAAEVAVKSPNANPLSEGIYNSTRVKFALQKDIVRLENIKLEDPFADAPSMIAAFHKQKIGIHERLIEISTAFMSSRPKPDVDYGSLAAEMPKLRASLEGIDETFMTISNLIFASLIDPQPDGAGHMSKLITTTAQRQDLIRQIRSGFGKKLDQKMQPYMTSAASVLLGNLQKDYTCSDEPAKH